MDEKTIFKIAIFSILIGLLTLFMYGKTFSLNKLGSLETAGVTEEVRITGKIIQLRKLDTVTFLTVEGLQTTKMDIVLFPDKDIYLREGANVDIQGVVEEYKGRKEIIASSVVLK